jgi:hypothetical protein
MLVLTLLLSLVLASNGVAKEEKAGEVTYQAETALHVTDGEGATLSYHAESTKIAQKLLFVDDQGNNHIRLNRGESVLTGHVAGKELGAKSRPARTDMLVFDKEGKLLNAIEIGNGIFLRGKDLAMVPRPKDMVREGKTRVLKMDWPVRDGPVIPVTVRFLPEGRSGGEGDHAWKEATFSLSGRTKVKGPIGGMLHLKGKGRMVVSKGGQKLIALDFLIESYLQQGSEVLARAEQKIRLRLEGDNFKGIPEFGVEGPASPRLRLPRFSKAPAHSPTLAFCLIGALMSPFGYIFHSKKDRYRRLERLAILILIPGLLVLGVSDSVEASVKKDMIWGAAALVVGALGIGGGLSTGVLGTISAISAVGGWAAIGTGTAALGTIITVSAGIGLIVLGAGVAGYGVYRLYKGFKARKALNKLAKDKDPLKRARAAETLGKMGDKDNTVALLNAMADPDPRVRIGTAEALAKLKNPDSYAVLTKLLKKETDPNVRAAIEKTLKILEKAGIAGGEGISNRLRALIGH